MPLASVLLDEAVDPPGPQLKSQGLSVDDSTLRDQIEQLVAEEQRLMQEAVGHRPDDARHGRLAELKVEFDRCWDLLRQHEAREEFQLDSDDASVRDAGTVEVYEQ
jgi:Protein of unknown function (DUF2630)